MTIFSPPAEESKEELIFCENSRMDYFFRENNSEIIFIRMSHGNFKNHILSNLKALFSGYFPDIFF